MLRKYLLYALASTSLIFTSCMDDFLERNPYGAIDETTFYTEAEHANLGAMACYARLQRLNCHWAYAQLELAMTGDLSSEGFKDAQPFYGGTFNPNESNIVQGVWQRCYEGIAVCNINIEGISKMSNQAISAEKRDMYLAEAKFIRAFWYLRLVQFYGDVPLRSVSVDDPTDASQVQLAATPKEEIFKSIIIPDLEFASQKLPSQWDEKYAHRATKGTAFAYLCEAYLVMKDYENALKAGLEVEKFGYELLEDPGRVLRIEEENSKEIVFSVCIANGINKYRRDLYFGSKEELGGDLGNLMRGDTYSADYFYPSKELVDFFQVIDGKSINDNSPYYDASKAWKNRDPRFDATFFTEMDEVVTTTGKQMNWQPEWLVNTPTGFDIQKRGVWYGDENWTQRTDVHFMRLPRVYLHIAEAYALKSNPDYAKCSEYLEKVRSRARRFALAHPDKYVPEGLDASKVLPPFVINSKESAMEAINYESRVEFFTEDVIRYFDLKRWGKLGEEWSRVGDFTWDEKLYNLPYPAAELTANPNLKQNHPGWGN